MKKIVIAPDSFKGSISATDAAKAIASGILSAKPDIDVIIAPVADGGEGTLDTLVPPENHFVVTVRRTDGQSIKSEFGYTGDTAVIESALAVGLHTVPADERNPEYSTTYGVGQLITAALDKGFEKIMITVGGSGSNDGGAGMLEALGAKFYNTNGKLISPVHAFDLRDISVIETKMLDSRLKSAVITFACDVNNPLLGLNGATYIYGAQKGADSEMLARLEAGMQNYSKRLSEVSRDVSSVAGTGAGGGLPVSLVALFGAEIHLGIHAVLDAMNFDSLLDGVSLVITGEGRLDAQSLFGKAVGGVADAAAKRNIPVVAIVGDYDCRIKAINGISDIFSLTSISPSIDYAMNNPTTLLKELGKIVCRRYIE